MSRQAKILRLSESSAREQDCLAPLIALRLMTTDLGTWEEPERPRVSAMSLNQADGILAMATNHAYLAELSVQRACLVQVTRFKMIAGTRRTALALATALTSSWRRTASTMLMNNKKVSRAEHRTTIRARWGLLKGVRFRPCKTQRARKLTKQWPAATKLAWGRKLWAPWARTFTSPQ